MLSGIRINIENTHLNGWKQHFLAQMYNFGNFEETSGGANRRLLELSLHLQFLQYYIVV